MDNPFESEFDSSEVVNKSKQGAEPEEPLFSESDINEFLGANPSDLLRMALEEEEPHKSLYKKEEIANSGVEVYSMSQALKDEKAKKFDFTFGGEPQEEKSFSNNFKDFVELPAVSTGPIMNPFSKTLIGSEELDDARKVVEIADKFELDEVTHKQASVVINRDMKGEIESIEIYCKCGERTFIKFDYMEDEDLPSDRTEVIKDPPSSL